MYYLQLVTTKSCNQQCYYCNVFEPQKEVIIDLDFLKYVLDSAPAKIGVELTGGEIGLVKNLDELFITVYNHTNIDKQNIMLLSNGLVRKRGLDWLNKTIYWEHLISDINDTKIEQFYDLDLEQKHSYVIVTTEKTTKSLLTNWKHFEKNGLFRKNFFYKIMNGKTHDISKFSGELFMLFDKLNCLFSKRMIKGFVMDNNSKQKDLCSKNSPNPFVDFDTKQLGHCAAFIPDCKKIPFNKVGLLLTMKGNIFQQEINNCCKKCYVFDNGYNKEEYILNCKNSNFMNRSYQNV
jgi:hypothetical protein